MVMLLDKTIELSPEERVDRAFRYDTLPEKVEEFRKNLELFHDYVRGGIEVMYEQFTDGCQQDLRGNDNVQERARGSILC